MELRLLLQALLIAASVAAPAQAAPDARGKRKPAQSKPLSPMAPLPADVKAAWSHAPYVTGDCSICHEKNDRNAPGRLTKSGNELCFSCHDEFASVMQRRYQHAAAVSCTNCHNPHNSRERKLLVAEMSAMCFGCHGDIQTAAEKSKVKHAALATGAKCAACHDPHASNVRKLLVQLPFDLCVSCHSQDGISDGHGGTLTNFKKWLDENKQWHAPVKAKDCSACHQAHGSDHFRLLVSSYPAEFYSPYDRKNYALCFTCHTESIVSEPETTTLTRFRDGSRNLHYVHVNKVERGRTCRACHEVHASKQGHQLRDGVPYGPSGWILRLNYTKTATGGSCAKTCHETQTYDNRSPAKGRTSNK
jgi:predicted CXXCH cytochrome family protein